MEANAVILNRRSIRKYWPQPIEDSLMEQVLTAGFYAPTAKGAKPWHFVIVQDRQTIDKMLEIHPAMTAAKTAPCVIVVCGDCQKSPDYWPADCAAATQNILLSAAALGLGTCWCGLHPRTERMRQVGTLLHLPESIKVYSAITIGYPDESVGQPQRFNAQCIHHERW